MLMFMISSELLLFEVDYKSLVAFDVFQAS